MMKGKALWIGIGLITIFSAIYAGEIIVEPNKLTVGHNETFSVIFSSKESINSEPDFSPLKENFDILSSNTSQQVSIINGRVEKSFVWNLILVPKKDGVVEIPAIKFGNLASPVKTVEVVKSLARDEDRSIIIETLIDPQKIAYEQTQIIYTVRFQHAINVVQGALSEIILSDPNAMIEKLGGDVEYEFYHNNGTHYHVIERKYAVFPNEPGELVFPPIVFTGRVTERGGSPFNLHSQFRRVNSIEHKIQIKPIPSPFQKSNWLGSKEVVLKEEWSGDPDQAVVGEPITWTVTITAEGCMGNQIPPLSINLPTGLKHYLDKPQTSDQANYDGITGTRQIKVALIPSAPGKIELPEISMKWWDLKTDQLQEAKIPARTLQVKNPDRVQNDPANQIAEADPTPIASQKPVETSEIPLWAWLLIGMNGIWIVGLAWWFAKKINWKLPKKTSKSHTDLPLKLACHANDPKQAEAYLMEWASRHQPDAKPQNLMDIKNLVTGALAAEIDLLYQVLYGRKDGWEGSALWEAFTEFKPKKAPPPGKTTPKFLRDLYPE